jgi:pyruvate formate lyase activating enzyme
MTPRALIFNVQSLSTQDGPGIRTAVFFQGCPLRCTWCSNPEGQIAAPQLRWDSARCRGCLECARACSAQAVEACEDGSKERPVFDRGACQVCETWSCLEACPGGALQRIGRLWSADELLAELRKDVRLFRNSGGGVTFTGGEPLMHCGFLGEVVRVLRDWSIHVAIETCGCWDWAEVAECLQYCDLIYFDMKTLDGNLHCRLTGRSNRDILHNLARLAESCPHRVVVSIPVVPGLVDSPELIQQAGLHIRSLGLSRARLLPYHALGRGKYASLGRPYPHESWHASIERATLEQGRSGLVNLGLHVTIEGWS